MIAVVKDFLASQIARLRRAAVLTACLLFAACNPASPTPPPETGSVAPSGPAAMLPPASAVASPAGPSVSPAGPSTSPTEKPDATVASPTPVAAGASIAADPIGLRVVESGFTAFSSDGNDFASFAAVIDNPDDRWAVFQMEITIDFFDGGDNFIAGEELFVQVLPGQRTAIAGEAFGAGHATRMTVNVPDDTSAYERSRAASGLMRITAVETSRGEGLNRTRGRLTSRASTTESLVQLTAVYRDGRGSIIGGAVGGIDSVSPGATIPFEVIDSAPFAAISDTEVYWQVSGVRR